MPIAPLAERLRSGEPPHVLFERLVRRAYPLLLDSGMAHEALGRYSFLACDPFLVMRVRGRAIELRTSAGSERSIGDPLETLEGLLARYAMEPGVCPAPFAGGAAGYLGYDLGGLIERLPRQAREDVGLPDAVLCFYDVVIAHDHGSGETLLISTGLPEEAGRGREERAQRRLREVTALLTGGVAALSPVADAAPGVAAALRSNVTREEYQRAVELARQYIIAGDVYQVNLSQRLDAPWDASPWALYRRVRALHPAPFAAYHDYGDFAIVSASPERFLQRRGSTIETRPIKGTRPRGATAEEDARLASELTASAKDRAEHIMIVDLERSDLGRVAQTGTVQVTELMALERYATVHHLTSTIRATLRQDKGIAALLRATFPGGSITGAPKIRAMEIIDELEPVRRGVYTGAMGYFSATGEIDLNIAIRTVVVKDRMAYLHVGGGIVYDSDAAAEYQETFDKGKAMLQALGVAIPLRDELPQRR
ncbi:MAG: aminodeoxychorismate synthase component I [Dehalococcoidia bacterium]|nr:aminodeoxychorismate synthase component I [Dehalococcoidia bacterium]